MSSRGRSAPGITAMGQLYRRYEEQAKKRGIEFNLSKEKFHYMTQMDCHYCGMGPSNFYQKTRITSGGYKYNGLDRVDSKIGYLPSNVVPCCKRCNHAKNDMSETEFKEWLEKIYAHWKI